MGITFTITRRRKSLGKLAIPDDCPTIDIKCSKPHLIEDQVHRAKKPRPIKTGQIVLSKENRASGICAESCVKLWALSYLYNNAAKAHIGKAIVNVATLF
jgi:hypothetical protein